MTREEKIVAIYKEMANKELTFGCRCIIKAQEPDEGDFLYRLCRGDERPISEIKEIIGYPVMIGDVLDWIGDKKLYCYKCKKLVKGRDVSDNGLGGEYYCDICHNDGLFDVVYDLYFNWEEKRKPIEDQTDACIDYVYSLIQKD